MKNKNRLGWKVEVTHGFCPKCKTVTKHKNGKCQRCNDSINSI